MSRAFRSWWSMRSPTPQRPTFPRNESRSRTTPAPSEERDQEEYADPGGYQNSGANIFAGEADLNVKEMAQRGGGHHRRKENTEQVSHPKLGRVHCLDLTPAQVTFQDSPQVERLLLCPRCNLRQCPDTPMARTGAGFAATEISNQSSVCWSASAGVASTPRGAAGRVARFSSASVSPAIAGDHGRSMPFGLTASTANPSRVRRSAIAPCRRKRSCPITGDGHEGGACLAATTSAARSQSSLKASDRNASATNPPSASCVTQPASSHETPSASEASPDCRASASAASHSFTRNASLAVRIRCSRPSRPRTPTLWPSPE